MDDIKPEEDLQRRKKLSDRYKGLFWILGGFIFLLQGLVYLNEPMSGLILLALEFIYVFIFPEKKAGNQPASLVKKIFQSLGRYIVYAIAVALILLIWVWLWQITRIPVPFLAAITCAVFGLVLFVASYVRVPDKRMP